MKLDDTDVAILNLVQQDSTITIKEIAKRLNLSTTPIFDRLKRMEKQEVIQKYVALINPKKVGKKLTVFVQITAVDYSIKGIEGFVEDIIKYPEVMECYHVTGNFDFLLKLVVEDIEVYNNFITQKLSSVSNLGKVTSSFSLSVSKHTTAFELDVVPKE